MEVWLLGKPGSFVESLREPCGRFQRDGGSVRFTICFMALVTMFAMITPRVQRGATSRRSTCRILIVKITVMVMRAERPIPGELSEPVCTVCTDPFIAFIPFIPFRNNAGRRRVLKVHAQRARATVHRPGGLADVSRIFVKWTKFAGLKRVGSRPRPLNGARPFIQATCSRLSTRQQHDGVIPIWPPYTSRELYVFCKRLHVVRRIQLMLLLSHLLWSMLFLFQENLKLCTACVCVCGRDSF